MNSQGARLVKNNGRPWALVLRDKNINITTQPGREAAIRIALVILAAVREAGPKSGGQR